MGFLMSAAKFLGAPNVRLVVMNKMRSRLPNGFKTARQWHRGICVMVLVFDLFLLLLLYWHGPWTKSSMLLLVQTLYFTTSATSLATNISPGLCHIPPIATTASSYLSQTNSSDRYAHIPGRGFVEIQGPDVVKFLQGLMTNHMPKIERGGDGLYCAFLTPQACHWCQTRRPDSCDEWRGKCPPSATMQYLVSSGTHAGAQL